MKDHAQGLSLGDIGTQILWAILFLFCVFPRIVPLHNQTVFDWASDGTYGWVSGFTGSNELAQGAIRISTMAAIFVGTLLVSRGAGAVIDQIKKPN